MVLLRKVPVPATRVVAKREPPLPSAPHTILYHKCFLKDVHPIEIHDSFMFESNRNHVIASSLNTVALPTGNFMYGGLTMRKF
jgi:hypothetical protein